MEIILSSCMKNTNLEFSSDCSLSQDNQMYYTVYTIYYYCLICVMISTSLRLHRLMIQYHHDNIKYVITIKPQ